MIIIVYIFAVNFNSPCIVFAESHYARALESTNLYRYNDSDTIDNIICIVEKSYFVEIISESDNYLKVNYNGISGYVKKNEVVRVSNTPSTPFPYNIKLTIGSDCNLRNTPTIKSPTNNIITTLSAGESDIIFIGRIFSDEAIDFGGTTWYYVNYQGHYGYVYNKYIKSITPIYANSEPTIAYSESNEKITNPITHTPSLLIIIILLIPCLIILLILYAPKKSSKSPKRVKKVKEINRY